MSKVDVNTLVKDIQEYNKQSIKEDKIERDIMNKIMSLSRVISEEDKLKLILKAKEIEPCVGFENEVSLLISF